MPYVERSHYLVMKIKLCLRRASIDTAWTELTVSCTSDFFLCVVLFFSYSPRGEMPSTFLSRESQVKFFEFSPILRGQRAS